MVDKLVTIMLQGCRMVDMCVLDLNHVEFCYVGKSSDRSVVKRN